MSNSASTVQASTEQTAQAAVLTEFRAWVLSLSEDQLAGLGIDMSVEEPLRLLRGFASFKGLTLG